VSRLRALRSHYGYGAVLLADPPGEVRFSLDAEPEPLPAATARLLVEALRTRRPALTDLYLRQGAPLHGASPVTVPASSPATAFP
jgi:hypothetical protein